MLCFYIIQKNMHSVKELRPRPKRKKKKPVELEWKKRMKKKNYNSRINN